MERRDVLKAAGGTAVATVGGVGAYAMLVRGENDGDGRDRDALTQAAEDAETRDGQFLLGVAPSSRDVTVLDPFETWLGKQHAVIGTFVDMGEDSVEIDRLVYGLFETTWARGSIPHVWWQPFFPDRENTTQEVIRELHEGEWDDILENWADSLYSWSTNSSGLDRRIYLNLAPEFNGDWSPWSPALGNVDEGDFVEMWRHIHDIVMDTGLESHHVQWIWTLDNTNRGVDREACYPGDEYVDWLAVHGYNWTNWGGWSTPAQVYGPTLDVLERIADKPIAITEFGTSSELVDGGHDPERKEAWITEAYGFVDERDIKMTLWFNIDVETDWQVFDVDPSPTVVEIDGREYGVYPSYREAVTRDTALGPHPTHPRRLTDEEFYGDFN